MQPNQLKMRAARFYANIAGGQGVVGSNPATPTI